MKQKVRTLIFVLSSTFLTTPAARGGSENAALKREDGRICIHSLMPASKLSNPLSMTSITRERRLSARPSSEPSPRLNMVHSGRRFINYFNQFLSADHHIEDLLQHLQLSLLMSRSAQIEIYSPESSLIHKWPSLYFKGIIGYEGESLAKRVLIDPNFAYNEYFYFPELHHSASDPFLGAPLEPVKLNLIKDKITFGNYPLAIIDQLTNPQEMQIPMPPQMARVTLVFSQWHDLDHQIDPLQKFRQNGSDRAIFKHYIPVGSRDILNRWPSLLKDPSQPIKALSLSDIDRLRNFARETFISPYFSAKVRYLLNQVSKHNGINSKTSREISQRDTYVLFDLLRVQAVIDWARHMNQPNPSLIEPQIFESHFDAAMDSLSINTVSNIENLDDLKSNLSLNTAIEIQDLKWQIRLLKLQIDKEIDANPIIFEMHEYERFLTHGQSWQALKEANEEPSRIGNNDSIRSTKFASFDSWLSKLKELASQIGEPHQVQVQDLAVLKALELATYIKQKL